MHLAQTVEVRAAIDYLDIRTSEGSEILKGEWTRNKSHPGKSLKRGPTRVHIQGMGEGRGSCGPIGVP